MDIKKTGQFIKTLRNERNFTQKDLAEILGCTDKAVSRWETGAGLPDVAILLDLSQALGVSVNEILRGERLAAEIPGEEYEKDIYVAAEIISAADETVIEVLKDTEKKIKSKSNSAIVFYALCILQLLSIFVMPNILSAIFPTAEPVLFILYPTALLCILVGFLPDRIKWLYPLFLTLYFFAPIPFSGNESHVYRSVGLFAFVIALLLVALCHGIRALIKYLRSKSVA